MYLTAGKKEVEIGARVVQAVMLNIVNAAADFEDIAVDFIPQLTCFGDVSSHIASSDTIDNNRSLENRFTGYRNDDESSSLSYLVALTKFEGGVQVALPCGKRL